MSTINVNPSNLFGTYSKLGPGEHNTIILILISFLSIWFFRIIIKLIETKRIYEVLKSQGQCLHLRGMAAYVGDFKRLHRGHITQILRLRRTVPAVVLPRIVVATFVDKNSFSIVPSPSSDSTDTERTTTLTSDSGSVSSQAVQCPFVGYVNFNLCTLPGVSTVMQLVSGLSVEDLRKYISFHSLQHTGSLPSETTGHFSSSYVPNQQPPSSPQRDVSVFFRSVFGSTSTSQSSWDRINDGSSALLSTPDPLAPLEPLIRRPNGESTEQLLSNARSSAMGTPSIHNLSHVLNLPSPSFLPVWGSIGDIVPVDTVQHTVVVETDQETPIEQPRPAKPVYTSPQIELPTDGEFRKCSIGIDTEFANATDLLSKSSSTIYLFQYSISPSLPNEETHIGGVPIAKTFSCLTQLEISYHSDSLWSISVIRQVHFAGLVHPDSTALVPSLYYSTFARLFQSTARRRRSIRQRSSGLQVSTDRPERHQRSVNRRALDYLTIQARWFLGTAWFNRPTQPHNIIRNGLTGSLFSNTAPPPIPPTPYQWIQLVSAQEDTDVYGLEADGEKECLICMCNPKEAVLLPCRHCSCCSECLKSLRQEKCPMCRGVFSSFVIFPLKTFNSESNSPQINQ